MTMRGARPRVRSARWRASDAPIARTVGASSGNLSASPRMPSVPKSFFGFCVCKFSYRDLSLFLSLHLTALQKTSQPASTIDHADGSDAVAAHQFLRRSQRGRITNKELLTNRSHDVA